MTLHRRLEERLAAFKGTEAALLFGSGYLANLGVVRALAGRGEVVFSDELNHASIIDGCRLSRAETFVYRHADIEHLAWGLRAGRRPRRADRHRRASSRWTATSRRWPRSSSSRAATACGCWSTRRTATGCARPRRPRRGRRGRARAARSTSSSARSARRSASYGAYVALRGDAWRSYLVNTRAPAHLLHRAAAARRRRRDGRARAARGAAAPRRAPAGQRRRAARRAGRARASTSPARRRRSSRSSSATPRTAMRICEAALEQRRLRPGDPAADRARGHVAPAPGGDGHAQQGRASRRPPACSPARRCAPASAPTRRSRGRRPGRSLRRLRRRGSAAARRVTPLPRGGQCPHGSACRIRQRRPPAPRRACHRHGSDRDLEAPGLRSGGRPRREPGGRRPGRPQRARRARQGDLRLRERGHRVVGGAVPDHARARGVRREPDRGGDRPLGDGGRPSAGASARRCWRSPSRDCPASSSACVSAIPRWSGCSRWPGAPGPICGSSRKACSEAGDAIEVDEAPGHGVTVATIATAVLHDHSLAPRLLAAPQLSASWRKWAQERAAAA